MPVQYTPQFIPTDVNLMNQMLNQRQQEHDITLARIAEMEDKYGQMRVDPSDVQYKNQLLGSFQQEVGDIVDRYGGDYGAASKDITRKLSKFRNDPFFQYAPYKAQLIEEARKKSSQLGPYALEKKGVDYLRGLDLSKGVSPDDLTYDIQDVRYIDPIVSGKAKEYATARRYDIDKPIGDTGYREIGSQLGFENMQNAAQWLDNTQEGQEFLSGIYEQLGASPGQYDVLDSRARDLALSNLVGQRDTRIIQGKDDKDKDKRIPNLITTASTLHGNDTKTIKKVANKAAESVGILPTGVKRAFSNSMTGYVGTPGFGTDSENPIINSYWDAIKSENPQLYQDSRNAYRQKDINSITKKYGISDDFTKKIFNRYVSDATTQFQNNMEEIKATSGDDPNTIALALGGLDQYSWNNYTDLLKKSKNKLDQYISEQYPEMNATKRTGLVKDIVEAYDSHNKETNNKFNKLFEEKFGAENDEVIKKFNFRMIDPYTEEGKKISERVNRVFSDNIPLNKVEILSGDSMGETADEIKDIEKSGLRIVGAGGNNKDGALFAVNLPDGTQAIAKLNVPTDHQIAITKELGNRKASSFAFDKDIKGRLQPGMQLRPGYTYNVSPSGGNILQTEDGSIVTTKYVQEKINPIRKKLGLEELPINSKKQNTPYEFDSVMEMISSIDLLNK